MQGAYLPHRGLLTVHASQMIQAYSLSEAQQPEMWGGQIPDPSEAEQLAACFAYEWEEALDKMLRHWDTPPTASSY
jgi:hypothetical protein